MSSNPSGNPKIEFLLRCGVVKQALAVDALRLENSLQALAKSLGIRADFFSTSTALMAAVQYDGQTHHFMKRINQSDINLSSLVRVNEVGDAVIAGELSVEEGLKTLDQIESKKPYGPLLVNACFALISCCIALFVGGSWQTSLFSAFLGAACGFFTLHRDKLSIGLFYETVLAFTCTLMAYGLKFHIPEISIDKSVLAAILIIVPGVSLTISITELATNHLVAGTSRFMQSMIVFFKLAFGVAMATQVARWIRPEWTEPNFTGYPWWVPFLAILISGPILTILFQARFKDTLWITLACILSYSSQLVAIEHFGPQVGIVISGAVVAGFSNFFSKQTRLPVLVTLLPGILVLVPGSIGFQSLSLLYDENILEGMRTAFHTLSYAVSLVAGLFLGNVFVKTRQSF